MKNTNRSIMSVVLALAMVFTSVSGFSKSASQNVKAGTPDVDITGVTVESNIVENGDAQLSKQIFGIKSGNMECYPHNHKNDCYFLT